MYNNKRLFYSSLSVFLSLIYSKEFHMSDIVKTSFLLGVITNFLGIPLQLAALLFILLPFDAELLNMLRCAGIVLGMLLGPICIGACTMKLSFAVPTYDVSKFGENKFAIRCAEWFQSFNTRLNKTYESFWTTDNRVACALLASLTTAFALSQLHTSFDKESVVMLTALSCATTFIVVTVLTLHFRLQKATP